MFSQKLEDFISNVSGPMESQYFKVGPFKSYIRRTYKYINGEKKHIIVRANTTNTRLNLEQEYKGIHKRTGQYEILDTYMTELAQKYGYDGIEVENVLNAHLVKKLPAYGYVMHDENSCCFWKPLK